MRPPQPEGAPRLDVSIEELEAWLERARPALGAEGYEKLRAAIRTLGYVTELLEKKETTPGGAARVVVSCQHGENRPGAEAGRCRDGGEEAGPGTRLGGWMSRSRNWRHGWSGLGRRWAQRAMKSCAPRSARWVM